MSREIWLLALVMFVNRSGAMVLPFLSIYLNLSLGMTLTQCGVIMSCYGLGSVAGSFIGGILTDEIGFFKVMVGSLLTTAVSFFIVMNLQGYLALCAGFFAISFLADIFRPANLTAIQAFSKKENLTRSIGLIRLAINLGYAFGPFFGGYIAASLGYSSLFIIDGSTVLAAAVLFYFFFRFKKQTVDKPEDDPLEIKKMPWQDSSYMLYLTGWGFIVVVFFLLIYLVPLYYKTELGFDESVVGLLMGLNGLIIFLIEMPLIYFLEKYLKPVQLIIYGSLLIGIGVLCFALFSGAWIAAIGFLIFITIGEILSFPFSNTYALSFSNERNRGKYMGFYTMTFSIAHVVSPLGWMSVAETSGFNSVWISGFILCLIGIGLIAWISKRTA